MENQESEVRTERPSERENLEQISHEGKIFMSALHQIEENGNVELIASLFEETAELWRQTFTEPYLGLSGARRFWKEYLDQFEAIHSRFLHVSERPGLIVLEWDSQGLVKGGRPIHYAGVSIIELSETKKIACFKTYFDSAHFILPLNSQGLH